jgi:hypothetical protein
MASANARPILPLAPKILNFVMLRFMLQSLDARNKGLGTEPSCAG